MIILSAALDIMLGAQMKNRLERIRKELNDFYCKESFFDDRVPQGILYKSCKCAVNCWNGISSEVRKTSAWNYFSLPYIGDNYSGELVCVGLNVNEGGGRNLQEIQIKGYDKNKPLHKNDKFAYKYKPGVIESLRKGNKNVSFREGMKLAVEKKDLEKIYGGTLFWHRIAVYSKILLDGYDNNVMNNSSELAKIFERIIYMDAIKCSPANKRSEPTEKMKRLCPTYILVKELEIIKPNNILIMSRPTARIVREIYHCVGGSVDFPGLNKDFDFYQIDINGKKINVFYIIHIGERGKGKSGTRMELFKEFGDFISESKEK